MKKLLNGIVEFRKNVQESYRNTFGKLATGQRPDCLFIACSDSRVVPNTFASTNPGDLFVIRNVGNIIPCCDHQGLSLSDESEGAAIEFAIDNLGVQNIVVCGHSECGAMRAALQGRDSVVYPHLKSWLRHADPSLEKLKNGLILDDSLSLENQLSQINVLVQMNHILSYPSVKKKHEEGLLGIHGWWFDITHADVYAYESDVHKFVIIDEQEADRISNRLEANRNKVNS